MTTLTENGQAAPGDHDPRNRDPRHPALYQNPTPNDVGRPSCHDLAAEGLFEIDGRVLRSVKADRSKLLRMVATDLDDRLRVGLDRYEVTLQPGNGRDFLIDLVQEDLDAVVYARGLLEETPAESERYAEIKSLYEAHLVVLLQTRAILARRNGELEAQSAPVKPKPAPRNTGADGGEASGPAESAGSDAPAAGGVDTGVPATAPTGSGSGELVGGGDSFGPTFADQRAD